MSSPKMQWYIKSEDVYVPKKDYYAGAYAPEDIIELDITIWNNRYGTEPVEDLRNPVLVFYFDSLEDSILLQYSKVSIDNGGHEKPEIMEQKAYIAMQRSSIKGTPNEGIEDNTDNYVDINIVFDFSNLPVKKNDLKNLYFEIVSQ